MVGIHINGIKGLGCGLQFDDQIRNDINSWIEHIEGEIDIS